MTAACVYLPVRDKLYLAALGQGATLNGEAIAATGPGRHFLGSEHTQANFMTALFRPWTPDDNSFEQWQAEGGRDAATRATAIWKERLKAYEDPGLDPEVDAALRDYIAQRKAEVPDRAYF